MIALLEYNLIENLVNKNEILEQHFFLNELMHGSK
jgi:hypothetical protein